MPAIAAVTLKNNALADVVFSPVGKDSNGVVTWKTSDSIYDAKKTLTHSVSQPKNGSSVVRLKQRIVVPVMNTVVTSQKDGEIVFNIEAVFPKVATETQRLDARKHAETLLGNAITTAAAQFLEGVY